MWLKRLGIWLRRFRHRRGYGIHSPSAFAFVTGVIYERGEYYAYEPLRKKYRLRGRTLKHDRLMLRLANHVQPHTIIVPQGTPEHTQAHLQAGCLTAKVVEAKLPAQAILLAAGERSMIIVPKLYEKADDVDNLDNIDHLDLFENLRKLSRVFVTYDLYDFGLICLDPTKHKQHYIINYESIY